MAETDTSLVAEATGRRSVHDRHAEVEDERAGSRRSSTETGSVPSR